MGKGIYKAKIEKLQKIRHSNAILLTCFLSAIYVNVFCADVRVGKTSMKNSNGESIVLKNSLSVAPDALVRNDGSVFINNVHDNTLSLNTILNGEGGYNLNSKSRCAIALFLNAMTNDEVLIDK